MSKASEIGALWEQIKPQVGELVGLCCEVEDHAEVTADAYQRGYEEGRKDGKIEGRAEAWTCVKKIAFNPESVECVDDLVRMGFDVGDGNGWSEAIEELFEKYTATEAIEKIRQYEQKQEVIKVGDEVTAEHGGSIFTVTWMSDRCICGIDSDGRCYSYMLNEIDGKTGNHHEIAEVLAKMKETDNG